MSTEQPNPQDESPKTTPAEALNDAESRSEKSKQEILQDLLKGHNKDESEKGLWDETSFE